MLSQTKFQGIIGGKSLSDYKKKIDWNIKDADERLKMIHEILNLDDIGSQDDFWISVWNSGICKANLNTSDTRWEETNIAHFLETVGSYLIYGYDKKKKKIYNELELNEAITVEDVVNDKNYRLAPPETIKQSDYKTRDLFNGTYEEYVEKVSKTPYEVKERESWERIKHNEEEKVKLLTEAKHNLDILKGQMEEIKLGKRLQYNENKTIKVLPTLLNNVDLKLSKQLDKYGLNNEIILDVEDKIYIHNDRSTNVMLWHLTDILKSMKDYMISCKLAYTNRVKIKPPKCPTVHNILENVDYFDETHIKAMLSLEEMELDPSNDLAIISNDMDKKIKELYTLEELSDIDMYVIDSMRHRISNTEIARELNVVTSTLAQRIDKICKYIAESFYKDYIDNYYLNVKKGTYKRCTRCKEVKLINQYGKNGKQGLRASCKKCECLRKKMSRG